MEILNFGNLRIICYTIVSKNNGFKGPGAFVFKHRDRILFAGYSGDLSARLLDDDFENYIIEGNLGQGIKYTEIDIYLTENNYIAARLAYTLIEYLQPIYNQELLATSELDIKRICEDYKKLNSKDKSNFILYLKGKLGEEEFANFRQLTIDKAWEL